MVLVNDINLLLMHMHDNINRHGFESNTISMMRLLGVYRRMAFSERCRHTGLAPHSKLKALWSDYKQGNDCYMSVIYSMDTFFVCQASMLCDCAIGIMVNQSGVVPSINASRAM